MSNRGYVVSKDDWETEPMPEKNTSFIIKRRFTDAEMENLKAGHLPQEMEDRWFSYFEDNKLYIHRSWSGNCIYIVEFHVKSFFRFPSCKHRVTVNRDENQYACTDVEEDIEQVNELLGYFAR